MTKQELDEQLAELTRVYENEVLLLKKQYILAHNKYKVGEVFTDHNGSILIEEIKISSTRLCCVYYGIELNRDLSINKRGNKRNAWQTNEVKK
jgi:hypothetical protein